MRGTSVGSKDWDPVVITGIGMITPVGLTLSESWDNMVKGKSGVRKITTRFDASDCATQIAGQVPDRYLEMEKGYFPEGEHLRMPLPSRMAVISAEQAVQDSGLNLSILSRNRVGVITGCCSFGISDQAAFGTDGDGESPVVHEPFTAWPNSVAARLGIRGPSFNVGAACASGAFAIVLASEQVKATGIPCVAIGVDTMVRKQNIDTFGRLMALSVRNDFPERASRPFDKLRDGFVVSEGACALILEPFSNAVRRGAKIYSVVLGYALTSEAHHIMAPQPNGEEMAQSMEIAIRSSGIPKDRIGYINAHGTSTVRGDAAETMAVKTVFGPRAYDIPVTSLKSMVGHTIGAAGVIECAITALTLCHQVVTPTINQEEPDPQCDLDYVPNEARKVNGIEAALSNSLGFGGHCSCIVLGRPDVFLGAGVAVPRIIQGDGAGIGRQG